MFFGDRAPPYPIRVRIWMTALHPTPLSEGLDPPLSLQILFPLKPVESSI